MSGTDNNTSPDREDKLNDILDLNNLLDESERDSVEDYAESLKSRGTKAKTSFRSKSYDELNPTDAIDAFKSLFPEAKFLTQYTIMGVKLARYIQNNVNGSFPDYLKSDNRKPSGNNHYRYKPVNALFWIYKLNDSGRFVKGNLRSDWSMRTKWFVYRITARTTLDYQAWIDSHAEIKASPPVETSVEATAESVEAAVENLADKIVTAEAEVKQDAGVDAEAARLTTKAKKAAKRKALEKNAMELYPDLTKRQAMKQLKKDWKDAAENKKGLE